MPNATKLLPLFSKIFVVALCALIFLPAVSLVVLAVTKQFTPDTEILAGSLIYYLRNSVLLALGGGALSLFLGVSSAWLITNYAFPWRRQLSWLLLLPLACPVYLSGFIYADMLDGYLANFRSMSSGMLLFGINLYPYVYIFARSAFSQQSADYQRAARSLGLNKKQVFWRISLPMALPFISFGFLLVVIEIINDFGLVSHYAINTLSLGIYRTWLGLGNFEAALQLSLMMLLLLIGILFAEARLLSKRKRFENISRGNKSQVRHLSGALGQLACVFCLLPIIFGFIIPTSYLIHGASQQSYLNAFDLLQPFIGTLTLVSMVILCCAVIGLIMNYAVRPLNASWRHLGQSINVCYALPGTLMGLALIWLLANLHQLTNIALFGSGIFALVYAYSVRFTSPINRMLHSSLEKITPDVERAARGFGISRAALFRRIHLPLIRTSLLGAIIIVFAETAKELPLALMLRPFNFETLATYTYQYASDELLSAASLSALLLIIAGMPALYCLNWLSASKRDKLL